MIKVIARILLVLLVVGGAFVFFEYRQYNNKVEKREEALQYFKDEDYAQSIRLLEEALEDKNLFSEKIDKDMKCYLAESYCLFQEYDKASELYDQMIEANPRQVSYYILQGECQTAAGDAGENKARYYQAAQKTYELGYEKTGDLDFLKRLCQLCLDVENYDAALSYADQGIKEGGDRSGDFLFCKVVIYEKQQDYEAAFRAAADYVKACPDDERGQKEYAFLASRVQQPQGNAD